MIVAFPQDLPKATLEGYTFQYLQHIEETPTRAGLPILRQTEANPNSLISVRWVLTDRQYNSFLRWYNFDLGQAGFFSVDLFAGNVEVGSGPIDEVSWPRNLTTLEAAFTQEGWVMNFTQEGLIEITGTVYARYTPPPLRLIAVQIYDGGNVAIPAPDFFDGGTVATAATDFIDALNSQAWEV